MLDWDIYRMDIGKKLIIALLASMAILSSARAQSFAVKTNLLSDVMTTANLGVEFGIAPRWTVDFSGSYNPWTLRDGRLFRQAMVQPELRYWFCDRFSGHFVAGHALGGIYNMAKLPYGGKYLWLDYSPLQQYRFQGWGAGAGLAYGYNFILGRHWNLELELGAGYVYSRYDQFLCTTCGLKLAENVPVHYVGPTKAAISLVYIF